MLTPCQQFKVGFLQQCARAGLSTDETEQLVKRGIAMIRAGMVKQSDFNPLTFALDTGKSLVGGGASAAMDAAKWILPLSLIAPPVVGGIGAYTAAKLSDTNDEDVTDVKLQEKIDAYRRAAEMARARTEQQQHFAPPKRRGHAPL